MMATLLAAWMATALIGQTPAPAEADRRDTPERRLDSMRGAMKGYQVTREGDRPAPVRLAEAPAFGVGRQKGNLLDGAIFLRLGEGDRPEAAMEAFLLLDPDAPDGKWIHMRWPRWGAGRSRSSSRVGRYGSSPAARPATRPSRSTPINTGPEPEGNAG